MYSDRANEHDEVECDLVVPGLGAIGFAFLVLAFSMKGFLLHVSALCVQ